MRRGGEMTSQDRGAREKVEKARKLRPGERRLNIKNGKHQNRKNCEDGRKKCNAYRGHLSF